MRSVIGAPITASRMGRLMPTRETTIRSARVAPDRLATLTYAEPSLLAGIAAANEPTKRIAASSPHGPAGDGEPPREPDLHNLIIGRRRWAVSESAAVRPRVGILRP